MTATAEKVINYLLVEDNNDHANVIERCFQYGKLPSDIHRVHAGSECITYLEGKGMFADRTRYPYPDVVLLDIRMPGLMDGLKTLQAIRFNPLHHSLPVVMLTTSGRDFDVRKAYEFGASGYVVKSEDTSEMIEKLSDVQRSFGTLNRLPDRQPEPDGRRAEKTGFETLSSADAETLPEVDEHTSFDTLVAAYEKNSDTMRRMLETLEQIEPERFVTLATRFCQEKRHLFAAGREVDWVFLWNVVMKRLPQYLERQQMAGVVASIAAELDTNEWASSHAASWYSWQGFCQAFSNQGVYSPTGATE